VPASTTGELQPDGSDEFPPSLRRDRAEFPTLCPWIDNPVRHDALIRTDVSGPVPISRNPTDRSGTRSDGGGARDAPISPLGAQAPPAR
jgi:hypothetical protein